MVRPGAVAGWPSRRLALGDDRVAQNADPAIDLDLDDISRLHPQGWLAGKADPFRRARGNHVARRQRRPSRAVRDQGWDVEDQIVDPGVLDFAAVEPRHQVQLGWIGDLVSGDDPRPKPARRVEILARGDRVLELDVPDRAVVEAGIAEDVAHCVALGNVAAWLADNQGELAFVIKVAGNFRAHHRLVVRHERVYEPQKDRGVLGRRATGLGGVSTIIAASADYLVGISDRRQQYDLRHRHIRCGAVNLSGRTGKRAAGNRGAQGGAPIPEPAPQIHDPVTDNRAVG